MRVETPRVRHHAVRHTGRGTRALLEVGRHQGLGFPPTRTCADVTASVDPSAPLLTVSTTLSVFIFTCAVVNFFYMEYKHYHGKGYAEFILD